MSDHFNDLTPAEAERLACLAEEMGEAIHIIGKILRHGYESYNPNDMLEMGAATPRNRRLLENELGHVRHWMIELCLAGDLSKEAIHRAADAKKLAVRPYLHHQSREDRGS